MHHSDAKGNAFKARALLLALHQVTAHSIAPGVDLNTASVA